ncbi:MAG TPA: hypothetical protein PLL36_12930, partial [Candidatus Hydrogenedentes bacterium]|nr:hypothetical protein [Candidatus Hydrogenedentota bacterium]
EQRTSLLVFVDRKFFIRHYASSGTSPGRRGACGALFLYSVTGSAGIRAGCDNHFGKDAATPGIFKLIINCQRNGLKRLIQSI